MSSSTRCLPGCCASQTRTCLPPTAHTLFPSHRETARFLEHTLSPTVHKLNDGLTTFRLVAHGRRHAPFFDCCPQCGRHVDAMWTPSVIATRNLECPVSGYSSSQKYLHHRFNVLSACMTTTPSPPPLATAFTTDVSAWYKTVCPGPRRADAARRSP